MTTDDSFYQHTVSNVEANYFLQTEILSSLTSFDPKVSLSPSFKRSNISKKCSKSSNILESFSTIKV